MSSAKLFMVAIVLPGASILFPAPAIGSLTNGYERERIRSPRSRRSVVGAVSNRRRHPHFAMSIRPSTTVAATLIAAGAALQPAAAAERRSTLDDQRSVAVTIYNDELALIKDVRQVVLDVGANRLALRDVS